MSQAEMFDNAKKLVDEGKVEDAFDEIRSLSEKTGNEYTLSEIRTLNIIICEKLTSCTFEEKKDACFSCLPFLEKVKIQKSAEWLELYTDAVYEVFSKLSRNVREEERVEVWEKLKDVYYEITLAAKKIWKEKNDSASLEVYVGFSKLVKSYLDVADDESFKICENYAKEAKFVGKGLLNDEEYRESKKSIEIINKLISDAKREKEQLE